MKGRGAIPWPIQGVLAGAAGTAAMTIAYKASEQELGTALRWGYGSAFGVMHGLLRRRLGEP